MGKWNFMLKLRFAKRFWRTLVDHFFLQGLILFPEFPNWQSVSLFDLELAHKKGRILDFLQIRFLRKCAALWVFSEFSEIKFLNCALRASKRAIQGRITTCKTSFFFLHGMVMWFFQARSKRLLNFTVQFVVLILRKKLAVFLARKIGPRAVQKRPANRYIFSKCLLTLETQLLIVKNTKCSSRSLELLFVYAKPGYKYLVSNSQYHFNTFLPHAIAQLLIPRWTSKNKCARTWLLLNWLLFLMHLRV